MDFLHRRRHAGGGSGSLPTNSATIGDHRRIDAPAEVSHPLRLIAGQRERKLKSVVLRSAREQLVAKNHVHESPRREEQQSGHARALRRTVASALAARRRSRRRAKAAARHQQPPRRNVVNRPAQLDRVTHLRHVMEEGRDLAFVEPLDGKLDARRPFRCRGDGIASFGLSRSAPSAARRHAAWRGMETAWRARA
jgi:hypothetical protein